MALLTERRFIQAELRADSQGDELSLVGYASVFNSQSEDLGGFREQVMPGAFARSIRESADVKCLFNHDPNKVLGRTKNGTLQLEEDAHGLRFRCVLPATQTARDLYASVKRGDIDSCSFAFIPKDQSWEDVRSENGDLYASRKLMDVDLLDVSAVTNPAYTSTSLAARALFPDGEPVELRSAITALAAKREVVKEEKRGDEAQPPMPYAISMPNPFDSDMKQEWWDAFVVGYLNAIHGLKQKHQEAIATGISVANLAWQPETDAKVQVEGQSKEETPVPHETVVTDASGRSAEELEAEARKKKDDAASDTDSSNEDVDDTNADLEGTNDDTTDTTTTDDTTDEGGDDGGDAGSTDVADEDDGEPGEDREGAKTKTVGGKALHSSDFAWVGDASDPSTWKLPVHDEAHAKNALARFGQTQGIPADKKDGVWKKIVSAAKKFGVKVTEENSLAAAMSHDVTLAILSEGEVDQDHLKLEAYVRMLELEIELQ